VVEYIRVDTPELWGQPPTDVINVANGLLEVVTRQLQPHSPDYLSSLQLPVVYDPEAECPAVDKFIRQVFPEDTIDLAYEIPGVVMIPGEGQDKAILLIGPGGNGKSVYLALVRSFVGRRNTSAVPLHKLEADRFSVSRLVGKLANICPDLPSQYLAGTSTFKSITGKDTLNAEYKYKDSFDFDSFVRLVFSANHLPIGQDSSEGFFDRWIVVPFTRSFRGTDQEIPRDLLDAQLSAPAELSGLLNHALDGLARFRANKRRYTISETVRAACAEFRATTDPLSVWLDANTVNASEGFVLKSRLLKGYNAAAIRKAHPIMTSTGFSISLKKLRPQLGEGQRTVNGERVWVWLGLVLRNGGVGG
jgi:P4 family phage/plasmid primase-like protien